MKRLGLCLLLAAWGLLTLGFAEPAPVNPTNSFYVNDYAVVITQNHRDFLLSTAEAVYEDIGVQAVVLTTDSLAGLTPEEYARSILLNWEVGGAGGARGILLLYSRQDGRAFLCAGDALRSTLDEEACARLLEEHFAPNLEKGNISFGLVETCKGALSMAYRQEGVSPSGELAAALEPGAPKSSSDNTFFALVAFALGLLVVLRGLYISNKYRKRYGSTARTRRRSFAFHRRDFDE